jgi:hypothetical protein
LIFARRESTIPLRNVLPAISRTKEGSAMRLYPAILGLAALVIWAGCGADQSRQQPVAGTVYGAGVTSAETIAVSDLLANPEQHLGETVRVQGPVVGVCKSRGCWIEIASDQEMQTIQLKVEDNVIVFPPEVVGEVAIVEGVLEGIPLTYEQACAYLESEARCQGEAFDPATVPAEGIIFYRIQGTGAVVLAAAGD